MINKKWARYLVGLIITVLAVWLSFRNLDWQELKTSFTRVNFFWVILAALNTLFSVYILSWRWKILLKSRLNVSLISIFKVNIISQYLNIFVPGRFGEILKAWLVSRQYRYSGSYILGTVVVDKMFDLFSLAILGIFAPLLFAFEDKLKGYSLALLICAVLIVLITLTIWKREAIRRWLKKVTKLVPKRFELREKLVNFVEKGIDAFSLLKNVKMNIGLVIITFLLILNQALTNLFLFQAYDFPLTFWNALVLQLILIIGMAPPSVPGRIGIFEYVVIFGLTLFDIEKSIALSCALVMHVTVFLPKILLGFVYMSTFNLSLKKTATELQEFSGNVEGEKTRPQEQTQREQ
ncbi:MAG: flippase-like domain-containing protein [bacterium]|nr:flippase-like domain-containing protein [bacterium]